MQVQGWVFFIFSTSIVEWKSTIAYSIKEGDRLVASAAQWYGSRLTIHGSWARGFVGSWVRGFVGSWVRGFVGSGPSPCYN